MEKLITSEHLSNIKFAADCAIKEPDSIYSQEFFMLLDETFGSKGDYESPTQAVAVAWLINRVNELAQRAEAAEAKLAELDKQKPVAWISSGEHAILSRLKKHAAVEVGLFNVQRFSDDTPIFTSAPIPTGWKVVPIEPTERMVIAGFESELDEDFSETELWEEFQMMSGCQQAAYKARLCWSAMIDAAPAPNE